MSANVTSATSVKGTAAGGATRVSAPFSSDSVRGLADRGEIRSFPRSSEGAHAARMTNAQNATS